MTGADGTDPYGRDRLRRALVHFLGGKALASALGIVNLIALIRLLSPEEFGLYAALLSIQVVFLAASSFGIESTMERYLPEVRVTSGRAAVLPFLMRCLALRMAALIVCALLLLAALDWVLPQLGLVEQANLVRQYVWVIVAVALMNSGGAALEALLHQRAAQLGAIVYALTRSAFLLWGASQDQVDIQLVVTMDLVAACAAFAVYLTALWPYFRDQASQQVPGPVTPGLWPRFRAFAPRNYAGQVLMQVTSTHGMRLMLTSLSGLLETARLGFAMSLTELLQRYLPATLLMRMIRPVFISRYLENRDFGQLNVFANIVLKLNMLMLAPVIGFVLATGSVLVITVSNNRYPGTQWLLLGVLALLVMLSHQVVVSVLAGTLEENDIQIKAAACALVAVPVAALTIPMVGAYGALGAAWIGAITFNTCSTLLLRRRGFAYRIDWRGLGRLILSAAPGAAAAWLVMSMLPDQHLVALPLAALLCVAGFALVAVKANAFANAERKLIQSILPKRMFPF